MYIYKCSIVPYIYTPIRRAKNRLTVLIGSGVYSLGLFGKCYIKVEQRNRHDNEAPNIMILNNFFTKNLTGTKQNIWNISRNKPKDSTP
jgi:hypothetical protein